MNPRITTPAALVVALLLGACSNGGSYADPEPPPPAAQRVLPATALASPAAYTRFVAEQPLEDRLPPLDLGNAVAPVSETEAPIPVT